MSDATIKLTKREADLLAALKSGEKIEYHSPWSRSASPYYRRADGTKCTAAAEKLKEAGLASHFRPEQWGNDGWLELTETRVARERTVERRKRIAAEAEASFAAMQWLLGVLEGSDGYAQIENAPPIKKAREIITRVESAE